MHRLRWFLAGAFAVVVVLICGSLVWISQARGFNAREQPAAVESWIAHWMRNAAMPSGAAARNNPIAGSPEVLSEARAHWADHCASCHANDGSGDTLTGKRTYPP